MNVHSSFNPLRGCATRVKDGGSGHQGKVELDEALAPHLTGELGLSLHLDGARCQPHSSRDQRLKPSFSDVTAWAFHSR